MEGIERDEARSGRCGVLDALDDGSGGKDDAKRAKDSAKPSAAAAELKQDMRKPLTDHVVWTRDYIIAAIADAPDARAAAARLMNQEDVGNAVAKFDTMKKHLTTTNEIVARLNKNRDDDVCAFDAVYDHIVHMSDALAGSIVKQFSDKFDESAKSTIAPSS